MISLALNKKEKKVFFFKTYLCYLICLLGNSEIKYWLLYLNKSWRGDFQFTQLFVLIGMAEQTSALSLCVLKLHSILI